MWSPSGNILGLLRRIVKPVSFCSSGREFCLLFFHCPPCWTAYPGTLFNQTKSEIYKPMEISFLKPFPTECKVCEGQKPPIPKTVLWSLLLHNTEDYQPRNIFQLTRREQDSLNSSRIFLKRCFKHCIITFRCSRVESNKCWHEPSSRPAGQLWTSRNNCSGPQFPFRPKKVIKSITSTPGDKKSACY